MSYPSPRFYNQISKPRKYIPGKKRFSVYWTWSYPWEANRNINIMVIRLFPGNNDLEHIHVL